ncbi:MAG: hypothetical protein V3V40_06145 [Nitrosomonadaceae bacterium]
MSERDNPLKTYLTDSEDQALDNIADKLGMNRTSFCRLAVLNYMVEQEELVSRVEEITSRFKLGGKRVADRPSE